MKEIRMDYSEYEKMVQTIKEQQETINELKKDSKVILVDHRFESCSRLEWLCGGCPKVIGDEKLAKQYLKDEFDSLSKEFMELKNSISPPKRNYSMKEKKSKFWPF